MINGRLHLIDKRGKYRIDTVKLFDTDSYETIVFNTLRRGLNYYQDVDLKRYKTAREAIKGHIEMCKKWSA